MQERYTNVFPDFGVRCNFRASFWSFLIFTSMFLLTFLFSMFLLTFLLPLQYLYRYVFGDLPLQYRYDFGDLPLQYIFVDLPHQYRVQTINQDSFSVKLLSKQLVIEMFVSTHWKAVCLWYKLMLKNCFYSQRQVGKGWNLCSCAKSSARKKKTSQS